MIILYGWLILTTCLFRQNKFNIYFNYHSDADECLNNSHNCTENATCTNIEGSFNCSCKPGYIGNGHNCSGWYLYSRFRLILRLPGFSTVRVNVQQCTFINRSKLQEIVTRSFYNNFIYLFKELFTSLFKSNISVVTYCGLTTQSSSLYICTTRKTKREYLLTPYSVLRWECKIRWLTEINSIHL